MLRASFEIPWLLTKILVEILLLPVWFLIGWIGGACLLNKN